MPRSTLPPIVWVASCGHRNEVRSERGGYPAKCKTCKVSVWVPKRGAGRAPSAREAAGRFGSGRPDAARTGRADRPPRHAGFGDEADAEAMEEAARRDLAIAQAAGPAVAQMAEDLARLVWRQPAGSPGDGVLNGVPVLRSSPAVLPAAKPKPVLRIRAEPVPPRGREPGPGFGEHLVPDAGLWCQVCSLMGWRNGSGRFARATVALEMQWDGRIVVCGNCLARIRKRFPGEVVSVRKLPGQAGPPRNGTVYRAVAQPGQVPRAAISGRQLNETVEISGRGREGQLALAQAARPPVSTRVSSVARCSCRGQLAGPGHGPGCVFSELAAPRTWWLAEGPADPVE